LQECKKIGISGSTNIQHGLHSLGSQVPELCAGVVEAAKAEPIGVAMQ